MTEADDIDHDDLPISRLLAAYRERRFTPLDVVEAVLKRVATCEEPNIWISRVPEEAVRLRARALGALDPASLPLYGVPFAIKDNLDLAGSPTTAACPAFEYLPQRSATVVQRLLDAGAIPIGKTNLDQFATGLVGTRSPYGECRNSFDPAYVSGGSSSGSALAVALGLVSFSLGTDTAGSGRVPAAFNNLVGLKPTCGAISTSGLVPACRSLDSVSIFALTAEDATRVLQVAEAPDDTDPWSRRRGASPRAGLSMSETFTFAVPLHAQLEFFGDADYAHLFEESAQRLESIGGRRVVIDCSPLFAAARLLYEGPWVAERAVAVGDLLTQRPEALHPVTRAILQGASRFSAGDAFRAQYRLMELRREAESLVRSADVLLMPTAGTIPRLDVVAAEPIARNTELGHYTNFVNLLDFSAVAVPAGFRPDRLPFGVTLIAPAWSDFELLALASRLHRALGAPAGACNVRLPEPEPELFAPRDASTYIAVCGAHMEGLPLNHELTSRGGRLVARTRTAPIYRMHVLPGGPPMRPGLVRVASGGREIELEVWALPTAHVGSFIAGIPSPLGIGKVQLVDGSSVSGFVCEAFGTSGGEEITELGGWRAYLLTRASSSLSRAARDTPREPTRATP